MVIGCLLAALISPAAEAAPAPLTDPAKADALAAKLGDDRTAGIYYEDGRLTVAVTDEAAAASVRSAGGTAKVVAHSAAELDDVHSELDQLAGIPNTSWGIDPSSNQVSVDIYEGVSAADRARIERVAAIHGDAVRIEQRSGELERTADVVVGGIGISWEQDTRYYCSSAFNVTPNDGDTSTGERFLLTAGHCLLGGHYDWVRRSNEVKLGTVWTANDWDYEPSDYAIIDYTNPNVTAYGLIQYKDGSQPQIAGSRWAVDGEKVKRVGTVSQDLDGIVLKPSTTTYTDGVTLYNMIETSLCNMFGDSGGAMFTGTTALGITSGGNYADQPCGDTDAQPDRASWFQPVQRVLIDHNLAVY
ncbi:S1 family peptidase [Streptomyces sp. NPDC094143]|uniref:S1 family peptidase n=1 Tax=Streptomyces sp. NPDC094143 TaxID=3155310 RepID=UPI003320AB32